MEGRTICATVLADLRRHSDAIGALEQTAALAREIGDLETLAHIVNNIGVCYYFLGRLEKAICRAMGARVLRRDSTTRSTSAHITIELAFVASMADSTVDPKGAGDGRAFCFTRSSARPRCTCGPRTWPAIARWLCSAAGGSLPRAPSSGRTTAVRIPRWFRSWDEVTYVVCFGVRCERASVRASAALPAPGEAARSSASIAKLAKRDASFAKRCAHLQRHGAELDGAGEALQRRVAVERERRRVRRRHLS